ncbi:zinc ABC transporter substrate-binding protein [Pseudoprimorskyibacter insulae]|uniref:High-affinity zinc uptake system protein ZnuA n=1 Tax=Pseudoprimorskyibacter insulae TaxID=1695997 RepID=A0A2R8APW7_9RHOB|nr:zinc ABC transporter substrate-binding protein [Pseudoprimorskyibacter insulae]SPF78073.1 High-affinity zinc uptake system protein ZnuA [Pseudoprimorskyibacter insulae]
MRLTSLTALALALPLAAHATPKVVTDIAPIHSLVAQVMDGVGTPDLLVSGAASPHGFALRPSQARLVSSADLIVMVAHDLTPWLEEAAEALAPNAEHLELLDVDGTVHHDLREEAVFDERDHKEHDHDHGEEGVDPHAWLDPQNAQVWLSAIAAQLSALDPDNAARYASNAETARAALQSLELTLYARLEPAQNAAILPLHDAYQYFEQRFDLHSVGAIAASDAQAPGPKRLSDLQNAADNVDCVLIEPQQSAKLAQSIYGDAVPLVTIDPLGGGFEPGLTLYVETLSAMADSILDCTSDH